MSQGTSVAAVFSALAKHRYFAATLEGEQTYILPDGAFEFTLVESGTCLLGIGDTVRLLHGGEYLLLPPKTPVFCAPMKKDTAGADTPRRLSVWFTAGFADEGLAETADADALLSRLLPELRVRSDTPLTACTVGFDSEETLASHVRALLTETEHADEGTDGTVRRGLATIFTYLWRSTVLSGYSDRATVNAIRLAVENEYEHELSLTTVCRLADGSQKLYTLSRMFLKETGMTFRDYLLRARTEKACALLQNTDMTVASISSAVGYNDASFFYKAFCRVTGVTPRDFRLRSRSL